MNLYHSNNIGNVAVLGHLGSGKQALLKPWQNVQEFLNK